MPNPTRYLLPAASAALAGIAIAWTGSDRIVDNHTDRIAFDLADLYQSGVIAGASATAGVVVLGLSLGRRPNPKSEVIRFLEGQTGRADLTDEQRAALAYVAQDLRDSGSDVQRSKGFKTFDS